MSLREDIDKQFIEAMKAKDAERKSVLSNLRSAIKSAEIDKRPEPLTEAHVLDVIAKEVKKLKDSLADFEKAGRADLAEANRKEIAIMSTFLPAQMSEDEVRAAVKACAQSMGLSGEAAFGKLMGACSKELKGKADGQLVSRIAKEVLSA